MSNWFSGKHSRGNTSHRRSTAARRRLRLALEPLEQRALLAVLFEADFTDAAGFGETEGFISSGPADEWHLSTGRGNQPGHSADTSFYFGGGENPFGGGSYGPNADGTLTSPAIDLTSVTNPVLTFNHYLGVEGAPFDFARVAVLHAGNVDVIATSGVELPVATTEFEEVELDLTPYAGQVIQLAFRLTADNIQHEEGWYIDDVVVSTSDSPGTAIDVVNASFEDITGETPFNEFTLGPLNGWDFYDPANFARVVSLRPYSPER